MALVQAVNTAQIQAKIDEFAQHFLALESMAEDLVAFATNLTQANVDNHMLLGNDGQAMDAATMAELQARLQALQNFVTWANTGGNSAPVKYLRGIKRNV
jgi:hypothetical protein